MNKQSAIAFRWTCFLIVLLLPELLLYANAQDINASTASSVDQKLQADGSHSLESKRFADLKVSIANGILTLSGTVDIYSAKEDAEKRARHVKDVKAIENAVIVGGPTVDDSTLRKKLAEKLTYDRVGYGTTAFSAFTLNAELLSDSRANSIFAGVDLNGAVVSQNADDTNLFYGGEAKSYREILRGEVAVPRGAR